MNRAYSAILKEYKNWLDTLGHCDGSVYEYPQRIKEFFGWLGEKGIKELSWLKEPHVKEYFDYLEKRPNMKQNGCLSNTHLNRNFIAVDKLLEFLHQMGMDAAPSPTGYRLRVNEDERLRKIVVLTPMEIKTLYDNIDNTYLKTLSYEQRQAKHYQLRLILTLYYACGLRRAEGAKLSLDEVDFDRKRIFIHQGKNRKDRIVPLNDRTYKELHDYVYNYRVQIKTKHNRLFIQSESTLLRDLQHLQEVAEVLSCKQINLHCLRHTIGTHLYQSGMEIEMISRFLGHGSLDTTQIYTHLI